MTSTTKPHHEPAMRLTWTRCRVTTRNKDIEIMVGRKRKKGPREPNGRVQRVKTIDPKAVAKRQPHRRGVPAALAHDPKAECIMGRLCLNGFLSETQYEAGVKYRTAVLRYRSAIEAPRASVASMARRSARGGRSRSAMATCAPSRQSSRPAPRATSRTARCSTARRSRWRRCSAGSMRSRCIMG
jgi:hypothetical protein